MAISSISTPIVLATLNPGKAEEFKKLAKKWGIDLVGAYEIPSAAPPPEVVEDADSYLGNARLKAEGFAKWIAESAKPEFATLPVLADDSGLEVSALSGAPGVYSARYAGEHATSAQNMAKLLNVLSCLDDRRAVFRCLLYLAMPFTEPPFTEPPFTEPPFTEPPFTEPPFTGPRIAEGLMSGVIATSQSGSGGFGYDSIFIPDRFSESLAEIKVHDPAFATHRAEAFAALFGEV